MDLKNNTEKRVREKLNRQTVRSNGLLRNARRYIMYLLVLFLQLLLLLFVLFWCLSFSSKASDMRSNDSVSLIVSESSIPWNSKGALSMPYLKTLKFSIKDGKGTAVLNWQGKKNCYYRVYRKAKGQLKYRKVATVKLKGITGQFRDTGLNPGKQYTYIVRQIKKVRGKLRLSRFDREGLTTIAAPVVKVVYSNMESHITWKRIKGVAGYRILRKSTKLSGWRQIKTVKAAKGKKTSYDDIYRRLDENTRADNRAVYAQYLDPSYNQLRYTVRAYRVSHCGRHRKISVGAYLEDGDFYLEQPTIISFSAKSAGGEDMQESNHMGTLRWGTVPNADEYRILVKTGDGWEIFDTVRAEDGYDQSLEITIDPSVTNLGVMAVASKNGKIIYTDFEKNFFIDQRQYAANSILVVGDSIMNGSPYIRPDNRYLYSIAHRIAELSGANVSNCSIGGSCYHYQELTDTYHRGCILTGIIEKLEAGEQLCWDSNPRELPEGTTLADFDVIILAGGTNDYMVSAPPGEATGRDIKTFAGAFNTILDKLEKANTSRVAAGKESAKVILVDLFYSNRWQNFTKKQNRDETPNKAGLTLTDYQDILNQIWEERERDTDLLLYHYKTREYDILTAENCDLWTADNLHLTKKAYADYGSSITQFMIEQKVLSLE